jgi:hypothetical protein
MPGVPRELAEHPLNIHPSAKPVRQALRRFAEPKRKAIGLVGKLGSIREVEHSD